MKPRKQQRRAWTRGSYAKRGTATPTPAGEPVPVAEPQTLTRAGLTPKQFLETVHGQQALLDYKVRKGELVEKSVVEAGHAEMREIIRADLFGAVPLRLANELGGKKLDAAQVRELVIRILSEVLRGWEKTGMPVGGVNA
jgi:hypothetical protein